MPLDTFNYSYKHAIWIDIWIGLLQPGLKVCVPLCVALLLANVKVGEVHTAPGFDPGVGFRCQGKKPSLSSSLRGKYSSIT
jgi:hypothetical protein